MSGVAKYNIIRNCISEIAGQTSTALVGDETGVVGIDETTDKVINGTFDTDTTGWTEYDSAIASVSGGQVTVQNHITSIDPGIYQQITGLVIGEVYTFSFTENGGSASNHGVDAGSVIGGSNYFSFNVHNETVTFNWKATATSLYLFLWNASGGLNTGIWDNISCRLSGNLVENHNFLISGKWTLGDGWSIGSGVASSDGTQTANSWLSQSNAITIGEQYVITFTITGYVAGGVATDIDSGNPGVMRTANGTYAETRTATSSTFSLMANSDFQGSVDNITCVPVVSSGASTPEYAAQLHGQLTRTAVALNSGLVSYSGFNDINYVKYPYYSSFDPSTNGFHIAFDFMHNGNPSNNAYFFARGSGLPYIYAHLSTSGLITFFIEDGSANTITVTSINNYADGDFHRVDLLFNGSDTAYIFVDQYKEALTVSSVTIGTLNDNPSEIYIGRSNVAGASSGFTGELTNFKFAMGISNNETDVVQNYVYERGLFKRGSPLRYEGEEIELYLDLSGYNPSFDEITSRKTGWDGLKQQNLYSVDKMHTLRTGLIDRANLSLFRDLMEQTKMGEIFIIDPYAPNGGSFGEKVVQRTNKSYSEDPVGKAIYQTSFEVREVIR